MKSKQLFATMTLLCATLAGAQDEVTIMLRRSVPLVMVRVPAGSFQMGSPDTERSRQASEGPVHTVNIAYDFHMGKYELTQQQWLAVMGSCMIETAVH